MRTTHHSYRALRYVAGILGLFVLLCGAALLLNTGAPRAAGATSVTAGGLAVLDTHVLGQSHWLAGGPAALRVTVSDHRTGGPVAATVKISETGGGGVTDGVLYSGDTNALGTVDATFRAPTVGSAGDAAASTVPSQPIQVTVDVTSALGADQVVQQVQLDESVQVMLSLDKPIYQPGQTMHMRALALDLATRAAVANEPMTFEVEDAKGNKVFKQTAPTSAYGIGSADFVLADEVNMGLYTVRALLPHGTTEKKVTVERYVLPKFKIAITTERPYYLPGETVKGTVQSDYFFGKPVTGGDVDVQVNTIDIGVTQLAELKGKTDANGTYTFEYQLPDAFVGQPFEQGKAVVEFHVTLKDTADQMQEQSKQVPVVKDPILLVIVPASRKLVPGVSNAVFIAAATPDGSPLAGASLTVNWSLANETITWIPKPVELTTDDLGIAIYHFTPTSGSGGASPSPADGAPVTITVNAKTADGQTATATQTLSLTPGQEGIILRTDSSLVKVGDVTDITTISSVKTGTVYLDVIRNKQTILTRALDCKNGQAEMKLSITPDMVGTCELHAYKILPNEDIIRDTQTLVVMPASDLTVNIDTDKGTYRPGEDALLRFTVTDAQKHPILAALGVAVVDESVFALSELQPGLEKIYFTLEKELMEPKVEIHGFTPDEVILDPPTGPIHPIIMNPLMRQEAAHVLFAAAQAPVSEYDVNVDTYQQHWDAMKSAVQTEMQTAYQRLYTAVNQYQLKTGRQLTEEDSLFALVPLGYLKDADLKDRWGNYYKSDLQGQTVYGYGFTIGSAGPDGVWGTVDDITGVGNMYGRFTGGGMGFPGGFGGRGAGAGGGGMMRGGVAQEPDMAMAGAAMPMAMNGVVDLMPPAPAPPMAALTAPTGAKGDTGASPTSGSEPTRVRQYFPETMYWNPAIITDANGQASVTVPCADSITTWRVSALANSASGLLGSNTAGLKVFQDFFVDIDLPLTLTQNDYVMVPVAVYNYLPNAQQVTLTLTEDPWFSLDGPAVQTVTMEKDQVKVVYFPITAQLIGHWPLTISAKGTTMSDAVRRSVDVLPDGKEVRTAINDTLDGTVAKTVTIPADAIDGASNIWVKLYPGAFSQVCEGLDGILRMPSGCFEQTSSSTYPNVLVLDYLKRTKKINPELQMKAEQYINVGYQRLVTFECKNGGFSWFGGDNGHQILTAYGLLEFTDMSKVHDVDQRIIDRTAQWLANQQKPDGSWNVPDRGIAEGITTRQEGALKCTAYIAWALAECGYTGPQVASGAAYVKAHLADAKDPYTLAIILNLLTKTENESQTTADVAQKLMDMAKTTDKTAWWGGDEGAAPGAARYSYTGASGKSADLETTGLAAFGLAKWGHNANFTTKVLTYLVQSKDSYGTWETTQGTVWSLKALLYASGNSMGGGKGTVVVNANGKDATTFTITAADSDVMRQVDLKDLVKPGDNAITLTYTGDGSLLYQIAARYYLPWDKVGTGSTVPVPADEKPPLSINVAYDKTTLATDDTATVTVTVKNLLPGTVDMPLIDIGLPPGFTPITDKLDAAVDAKTISKYTVAARQIIVYMENMTNGQTVTLTYQLKAKFPIKARTPASSAYPYYNPEKATVSPPQNVVVNK